MKIGWNLCKLDACGSHTMSHRQLLSSCPCAGQDARLLANVLGMSPNSSHCDLSFEEMEMSQAKKILEWSPRAWV